MQMPKVDLSQKLDSVELSKKITNKSKAGKYIKIGIILAAVVAGVALINKYGIKCNSKKINKYAEKLKNEVTELFTNEGMKDGKKIAEIADGLEGQKIMREFASDSSTVLRESTFVDRVLSSIKVKAEKGKDVYEFNNGLLSSFFKSKEALENGGFKAAKMLGFENGKLIEYAKGVEKSANGDLKIANQLKYKDGKLIEYAKGVEGLNEENEKCAKKLSYQEGKLINNAKLFIKNLFQKY